MSHARIILPLVVFCLGGLPASATVLFSQPGLPVGSQYRIIFVTSTTGLATSTNIGDYNTFVDSAANAGGSELQALGATWSVVGSTQSVSAAANIGGASAVPIYLLDGTLVANDTADLFDGTIAASVDIDELGNIISSLTHVWTGSGSDGSIDVFGHYFGNAFNDVEFGGTPSTGSSWLHFNDENSALFNSPFYGISSILTVTSASTAPEPATAVVIGFGVLLFSAIRAIRRAT